MCYHGYAKLCKTKAMQPSYRAFCFISSESYPQRTPLQRKLDTRQRKQSHNRQSRDLEMAEVRDSCFKSHRISVTDVRSDVR